MTGHRALALVIVVALLSIVGIIGLLLTDRAGALLLMMTAAPLILGAGCWVRERSR